MLPGGDCAAMDGYAVCGPGPWLIAGRSLAGHTGPPEIRPGTAVEIATGALVPKGTQVVLPYESCLLDGAMVTGQLDGKNPIRRPGDDLLVGEVLATSGTVVRAALAGLISHAGVDEVAVRQRPRVRVLVTGDEIVQHGPPPVGRIRDALGPLVTAFVRWSGAAVTQTRHLSDEVPALVNGLDDGDWDVAVVTGSSSVGPADHLHEVLDSMGAALIVDGVACRPGHPQSLAQTPDGRWVVGLPGSPYAGLAGCLTLLEPLLNGLLGRTPRPPQKLPLVGDVRPTDGATRLVPVRIAGPCATAITGSRPASLRAAAGADALAVVESHWVARQPVELLALP
jgi:molybdopterin molybdotransferase